ncbi:MAG: carboxypeptidase regulatory-like domain-containing protein [Bryobacteraceae bacterium]|nr:carboxypeptidase regulatory-like domain-containing protein [Bryobacteraceae bacterium]
MLTVRFCLAFLVTLASTPAFAQITGDLRGIVLDTSGAAMAGAKVVARNLETSETRTAETGNDGIFVFNLLKIGRYDVRAEAPNFKAAVAPAEVRAGEVASVRFALELGQVTETVTVAEAVAQIDIENAQLQTSVVGQQVLDIPVNRNPNNFAITAPGTAPVSSNNPFLGSGSFNTNGGRGRGNNITINGITATDVSVTGTGGPLTPLIFQSIREVKVITNNFNAEYGRNASSQVMYLTKSGSNGFHGEAFEFFQNDKLNARPFFDRTGRTNIVRYNQYGFVVGGPVLLPKLADWRNKVFWFAGYEGQKRRGAGAARVARVPTPTQLSSITDPTARALAQQYQLPSDPSGQIQTAAPNTTDIWKLNLRGDINITQNDVLWISYMDANDVTASSGLTFINSNLPGFGASSTNRPRNALLSHTHTFGATSVNEFRFGFGRSEPAFPIDTPYPIGPRLTFQDGSVNSFGVWEGLPQGRSQNTWQFSNIFSHMRSRHSLKAGFEYYYLQADSFFDAVQRPLLTFANFNDFAGGRPAVFQQRFGSSVRENRVKNLYGFFQDDWKATRNLTINLGLRVEWAGGPYEKNGIVSNLNLDNRSAFGAAGSGPFGLLEQGKPSFDSNYNWAPRFGFAWTPMGNQKTVIRGGYGIAYDFVFLNPITNQRFLPPFIVTGTISGQGNFTGDNTLARIVAGTAAIQSQTKAVVGQLSTSITNFGAISPAIAQDLANGQVQQWNFGVQRETFGGIVVKASYVGTKGNYLPRGRDINLIASPVAPATSVADETARLAEFRTAFGGLNAPASGRSNRIDPRYNGIIYNESSANSSYHAGQFEVFKRFNSMSFTANYTYGKSIDDNSDVLGVLVNDSANQQNPLNNKDNRAVSQFDLRQRVVFVYDWKLPFFLGSSNRLLKTVVGGWGFSGITAFRSGFPVNFDAGSRRGIGPLSVLGGGAFVRPNAAGAINNWDPRPSGSAGSPNGLNTDPVQPISSYAQSLGLSQPLLGNFGGLGRNVLRLNGERNFDWNLYKNFNFTESKFLQFRAEFYNVFNNTSFQTVDATITSPSFGQYQTVAQDARFIQLGLRFVF